MRIPIASDLKTRTGAPDKDARLKNSYVETKGEQSVVRKRPIAQGGLSVGTGTAQGGLGLTINGTPYFIGFWGDTMQTYNGSGSNWNSGTSYLTGDHVSVGFQDYWALDDNAGNNPQSSPTHWSSIFVPARVRYTKIPTSASFSIIDTPFSPPTGSNTRDYSVYVGGTIVASGTGTVYNAQLPTYPVLSYSNYFQSAADMAYVAGAWAGYGITISYPAGYSAYILNATINYVPTFSGSGSGSPI